MKTKYAFKLVLFAFLLFSLESCNPSKDSLTPNSMNSEINTVRLELASQIASVQAPKARTSANGRSAGKRTIKNSFTVKPDSEDPLMYIFNYEEGGFLIVSADNRLTPILAFSDKNSFTTDSRMLPSGLLGWFSSVQENIKKMRIENPKQELEVKKVWDKFLTKEMGGATTNSSARYATVTYDGDCNYGNSNYTQFIDQQPLVLTTWNQGDGYNDNLTNSSCSGTYNGKVWVGCVPVAVAQIMKFHQYPSSYSWSSMATTYPTSTTASLMYNLGTSSNLNATYGCDGTSAPMTNIATTFSNFGYTHSGSLGNYSYSTVKSDLFSGYPVILNGGRTTGWWIFGTFAEAHCWVGDGLAEWSYFRCYPDPNTPGEQLSEQTGYDAFIHMNWGWGGNNDGYYSAYNWNPSTHTFNYAQKHVVGIRP